VPEIDYWSSLTEPGVLYIAFSFATSEPAMVFHIFGFQTECTGIMIALETRVDLYIDVSWLTFKNFKVNG